LADIQHNGDVWLENLIWFTVVIKVQISRRRSSTTHIMFRTYREVYPNLITNVESKTGTLFKFLKKSVSLRTFSLNSRHPVHLCGRLLYRTVFKPKEKRTIHEDNFSHSHKCSKAFTTRIFVKLVNAECHQVRIFYTKFHPNRSRNTDLLRVHLRPSVS